MSTRILFSSLWVLLVISVSAAAQVDYYSQENILKFSESLYANGDYELAAGEFLRVAALTDDARLRDSLWYRTAAAYINLRKPAIARKFLHRISIDSADTILRRQADCMAVFSYYLEKKYDSAIALAGRIPTPSPRDEIAGRAITIAAASLLRQNRWKEGVAAAGALSGGTDRDTVAGYLLDLGRQGAAIRLKSPFAAAVMSAIVPGSGKVYAHRGWDGFVSALIVGTAGWQAWEGYRKDGAVSVRCIGFGMLGFTFYSGNIYGSYTAARLYNRTQKSNVADRVRIDFTW